MTTLHVINSEPEPVGDLIDTLERLLVSAKDGQLQALAFVASGNDQIIIDWAGSAGTRNSLAMGIMLLHAQYAQAVLA